MPGVELKSPLGRGTSSRGYSVMKPSGKGWIHDFKKGKGGESLDNCKRDTTRSIVVIQVKISK